MGYQPTRVKTNDFYFKKTLVGFILMVEESRPADYPGSWYTVWVRANEKDAQEFKSKISDCVKYKCTEHELNKKEHYSEPEFYFKKTWRGTVLMKLVRYPSDYRGWYKASEYETQVFFSEFMDLLKSKEYIQSLKETNPELLI